MSEPIDRGSRGRLTRWLLLAGLVGLALVATGLSWDRARADARDRDDRAAALAAEVVSSSLRSATSSLRGIDGVVADGEVTEAEFSSFSLDVLSASLYTALAYVEIVSGADRDRWSERTGLTVVDTDGAGGFRPAPDRAEHLIVRYVSPSTETSRRVLGFDIGSDPVRRQGATESLEHDDTVLVGPIRLAQGAGPGLFAIHAVRLPTGEAVGFVASGISVDSVIQEIPEQSTVDTIAVDIDGTAVTAADADNRDGGTASFTLGGRQFTVHADDPDDVNVTLPGTIALGTALLLAASGISMRNDVRERRHILAATHRQQRLALLAAQLGTVAIPSDVRDLVVADGGRLVDADRAKLVPIDHATRQCHARSDGQPADPWSESASTNDVVVRRSSRRGSESAAHRARQTELYVPIISGVAGAEWVVQFLWYRHLGRDELDALREFGRLLSQTLARATERTARAADLKRRLERLSAVTRDLATAHTTSDVQAIVHNQVPALLDAAHATISPSRESDANALTRPIDGHHHLMIVGDQRHIAPHLDLLETVTEILANTWQRATISDHEHSVLQQLQTSLLSPPPDVRGYRIAVTYRSAIESIGIGGDWYSIVDHADQLHAVIGDVAGHGPGAVAIMAEAKTIIRHLLTAGTPLHEVAHHVDVALRRRNAFASLVLATIDKQQHTITYLNAGHLPPLLRHDGTVRALNAKHSPWLGLPTEARPVTTTAFPPGATFLAYTDGLIEQRGIPLDTSIDDLATIWNELPDDPNRAIELLVTHRDTNFDAGVDDDIAVIAIQRVAGRQQGCFQTNKQPGQFSEQGGGN